MDGNGRWAQRRLRPRILGHVKGAMVARQIITASVELGIPNLTLYAFSTENWKRPEAEVSFLMKLLERHLRKERETLVKQNIRFHVLGDVARLPESANREIHLTLDATSKNTGMNLTFALNYGGRQEILNATRSLAALVKNGELEPSEITEAVFESFLEASFLPDPDLIIRTSGEYRLSNFFTWQSAYSELYVSSTFWPDFKKADLLKALACYDSRERRFGAVNPLPENQHEQD